MLRLVQQPSVRTLSCSILSGKIVNGGPLPPLFNPAYLYWKNTWSAFFRRAGSPPDALKTDNFIRADYVVVLHDQEEIAGMVLASVFHGQALTTFDHLSVAPFPERIHEKMRNWPGSRCLTGEYLSVNPTYKKSVLGVSLAEIMCGILHKILDERGIEMLMASTVRAAHVADIGRDFGYEEVGSFTKLGVDCVLMFNTTRNIQRHPNEAMLAEVDRLWSAKNDYTNLMGNEIQPAKAA
jgi:hypothetical protein